MDALFDLFFAHSDILHYFITLLIVIAVSYTHLDVYKRQGLLNAQRFTVKDIQEWLGHSDIQTTANTYAHLDIKRKQ